MRTVARAFGLACISIVLLVPAPAGLRAGAADSQPIGPPFFRSPAFSPAVAAMGGASAAWVDDLSALYFNPAGLAGRRFDGAIVTAVAEGGQYGSPASQLEALRRLMADPAAGVDQTTHARLATLGGLLVNGSALGVMAQGEARLEGGSGYGHLASAIAFGSGYPLGMRLLGAQWQAGTTVRLVQAQHVRVESSNVSSLLGRGFSVDVGVRASWRDAAAVGLVLHDAAGSVVWRDQGDAPVTARQWLFLPEGVRLGFALTSPDRRTRLAGEWGPDGSWAMGLEQRVLGDVVAVRIGKSHVAGQDDSNTVGLGLKLGPVGLDAALLLPQGAEASTAVAAVKLTF